MRLQLHWQILIALLLASLAGWAITPETEWLGISVISVFDFVGQLFLNALKMIIVPLIIASIIVGVSGLGGGDDFGRLGGKTLLYYVLTSTFAILIGVLVVNIIQPGIVDGEPARDILGLSEDTAEVTAKVEGKSAGDIVGIFLRMIPTNVVNAAAQGQMLGIIFFGLLFGIFMTRIKQETSQVLKSFWQGVFDVMMLITDLVMKFAPIGVFALVAKVVAVSGFDAFKPLLVFFFTVLAALVIHIVVVMPLLLRLVAGVNPIRHYQAMAPALLTAFSTASSSASLPVTIDCVENRAGVSNRRDQLRVAAGCHRQHGWHGPLRVCGCNLHCPGIRAGPDGSPADFHCCAGPDDLDRSGGHSCGKPGGHLHHSRGHRTACRGDRPDSGGGSGTGHVPHRGECVQRFMRCSRDWQDRGGKEHPGSLTTLAVGRGASCNRPCRQY